MLHPEGGGGEEERQARWEVGGDEVVVNNNGGEAVVVEVSSIKGHLSCQVAPGCMEGDHQVAKLLGTGQVGDFRPPAVCVCPSFVRHLVIHCISHQASAEAIHPLGWSPLHLVAGWSGGGQVLLPLTPATCGFPPARSKS